jgi:hypothetical protein
MDNGIENIDVVGGFFQDVANIVIVISILYAVISILLTAKREAYKTKPLYSKISCARFSDFYAGDWAAFVRASHAYHHDMFRRRLEGLASAAGMMGCLIWLGIVVVILANLQEYPTWSRLVVAIQPMLIPLVLQYIRLQLARFQKLIET